MKNVVSSHCWNCMLCPLWIGERCLRDVISRRGIVRSLHNRHSWMVVLGQIAHNLCSRVALQVRILQIVERFLPGRTICCRCAIDINVHAECEDVKVGVRL